MFITLTMLAAIISSMFVATIASTVSALRRESEAMRDLAERRKPF